MLEFGTVEQYVPKEARKASINIQLVRNGLVIPVDCEHGTGMEHIVSANNHKPCYSNRPHCNVYDIAKKS